MLIIFLNYLCLTQGSHGTGLSGNQPSLAIIVRNLKICSEKVVTCVEANKQATLKLNNIDELSMDELREVEDHVSYFGVDNTSYYRKVHNRVP